MFWFSKHGEQCKLISSHQHKMFIAQRNNSRNKQYLTNSSQPTNRAILDEQPLFLSRLHYLERPLQPKRIREAIEAPSSQAISLNKLPSKSDNFGRPLQPKRNPSRPLQPRHSLTPTASTNRMGKLITSRPLQPHFIRVKKLYRWIKRRQIWVGHNWQNKKWFNSFCVATELHPSA